MRRLILLALCALLLAATGLAAPIYKWKDADGQVHLEDRLPPQGEVQVIRPPQPYLGEPEAEASGAATPGSPTADEQAAARAAERQRMCAQSRERLAQGEAAERMYELDDQGNRVYLSEDRVEAHLAELRAAVASWCEEP